VITNSFTGETPPPPGDGPDGDGSGDVGDLPITGFAASGLLLLGVLLLVTGAAALVRARYRASPIDPV
jgi:LPXTG-motif cell wall-anchored protein